MRHIVWTSALALAFGLTDVAPAKACAPAPPPGAFVEIAEETALIVWNAEAKQEHFIRRGAFRTGAKDFGFLVPTPSKPELEAVPDKVLAQFDEMIRPEIVAVNKYTVSPLPLVLWPFYMFLARGAAVAVPAAAVAPVRVLETKRIAGYDAAVLEADDAGALATWLKEHGYDDRPALQAWLRPYVESHWKITAFKIVAGEQAVETDAIRMTFSTDKPVYPYREPADQRENLPANAVLQSRLLRVFFLGTERVRGSVGSGPFLGKTVWSGLPKSKVELPFSAPARPWLTVFEDSSSPRPGTDDLFFAKAPDQADVRPPPITYDNDVDIPLPLDVVALVGFIGWRIQRRRVTSQ
jgi:hypothetical protein